MGSFEYLSPLVFFFFLEDEFVLHEERKIDVNDRDKGDKQVPSCQNRLELIRASKIEMLNWRCKFILVVVMAN